MCTMMFQRETRPAEKRSQNDSRKAVDKLMEYDKLLSSPFTRSELQELFAPNSHRLRDKDIAYSVLTDEEKQIVDELAKVPETTAPAQQNHPIPGNKSFHPQRESSAQEFPGDENLTIDYRRMMKSSVTDAPSLTDDEFNFTSNKSGKIYVWLDNMCFGNSGKKGFYYVRYRMGVCKEWSTAYEHPALIVQKDKLRPDQIDYMERKCQETMDEARKAAAARQ